MRMSYEFNIQDMKHDFILVKEDKYIATQLKQEDISQGTANAIVNFVNRFFTEVEKN